MKSARHLPKDYRNPPDQRCPFCVLQRRCEIRSRAPRWLKAPSKVTKNERVVSGAGVIYRRHWKSSHSRGAGTQEAFGKGRQGGRKGSREKVQKRWAPHSGTELCRLQGLQKFAYRFLTYWLSSWGCTTWRGRCCYIII